MSTSTNSSFSRTASAPASATARCSAGCASPSLTDGKLALAATPMQPPRQKIAVIGAALDLGAGRRGVDMGPSAIRYAGLDARLTEIGHTCVDRGNVETAVAEATTPGDES